MSQPPIPSVAPLAQCSITGKMVPEDEIVTIQGHRVCAEGKAILLERLKSGEAMPGELEKPNVLRRFGCIFVDGLIIGIPIAIVNGVLTAGHAGTTVLGIVGIIGVAIQVIYFGQLHASRGQTVGKMAGKLMVVNEDGSRITTNTAYVRAVAYAGPGALSGIAILTANPSVMLMSSFAIGVYGLINIICALVDTSRQRALHDRIAGTRVVLKE